MRTCLGVMVVATWAATARADPAPEPIAVVSEDPEFRAAVADALAPAGMVVRQASDAAPSIAEITPVSRQIAERERATSTLWLVFVDAGATLIAYDRGVDRVLVRPVPYPVPLSPPHAAEAARMARTMLRALRVTPDTDLQPPRAEDAAAVRARATPPAVVAPLPLAPRTLAIAADAGVRVGAPGATASPAVAVGLAWRPDRLGVALTARVAPAEDLGGAFTGSITDQSLAVTARRPFALGPATVIPGAGLAVHRVALDGTLGAGAVADARFDPAVRVETTVTLATRSALTAGLGVSVDGLLRRQTYDAGTSEVLAIPVVQVAVGLVVVVRIL